MSEKYRVADPSRLSKITQNDLEEILETLANTPTEEQDSLDQEDLTLYVITEMYGKGIREFTDEMVAERYSELVLGYVMRKLSSDGLVDVLLGEDGEPTYKLTPEGVEAANQLIE